jgi:hypothetical protein
MLNNCGVDRIYLGKDRSEWRVFVKDGKFWGSIKAVL